MKIIYVHHAERDLNSASFMQDHALTEKGEIQAKFLSDYIDGSVKIKSIYTSPFKRCIDTAKNN